MNEYTDEPDYDLMALLFSIAFNLSVTLIIGLIYWVWSCKRTLQRIKEDRGYRELSPVVNPDSVGSEDLNDLKQPLMNEFKDMENDWDPFEVENQSNIINSSLDLKKFFSVEGAASRIGQQTPSTFMRRSFNLDNLYMKDGEVKVQSFWAWIYEMYKMKIEQVRTIWNYDAYIYMYYHRMSAIFFALLSILNLIWLYVYHFVGEPNENLTALQRHTILSMYGSKLRIMIIYGMTILNSIAGYVFLYRLMRVFRDIEFQDYQEDYGDYEVSKTTVMIHNIPPTMPVIEANTLLGQIFKSRFGKDLESVHTVGRYDKRKLDINYAKRNLLEDKLEYYSDLKLKNFKIDDLIKIYKKNMWSRVLRTMFCGDLFWK